MTPIDLTVVSDCVLDVYFRVGGFPLWLRGGEAIPAELLTVSPGGGCNVAVAASKLGLKVEVVDKLGDDLFGKKLLEELRKSGVETRRIKVEVGAHTSTCVVLLSEGGEHVFVGSLGPRLTFNRKDLRLLERSRAVFVDGYAALKLGGTPIKILTESLEKSRLSGHEVFFDPGPLIEAIEQLGALLSASSVVLLNEEEWGKLIRLTGSTAERLSASETTYVVKRGWKGATVYRRGSATQCKTPKTKAATTVGAGDVFDAAYIWGTLRGLDPKLCCDVANAAAALKLKGVGIGAAPTLDSLLAELEKRGVVLP